MDKYLNKKEKITNGDFIKIANKLLNNTILKINGNNFRIAEIEFYLRSIDHPDDYTHQDEDQLKYGTWYFHKYKTGTYKSGTYKGFDLTIGDETEKRYCGILIRSLYDIENNIMIEGPCKCVNKILELYNCKTISEFTNNLSLDVLTNDRSFVITYNKFDKKEIYYGPRIGLSDKYPDYKIRLYRFALIGIKKSKKTLNKIV